jgi:citrate lyase subunit beta/citryl-CoA lyase
VTSPIRLRSLLTAPAARPDLVAKTPRSAPDGVFIDLEDGTPPGAKIEARAAAREAGLALVDKHPEIRVYVRVNGTTTEWFEGDVAGSLFPGLAGVVVPKLESAAEVARVADALAASGFGDLPVLAGIESARGVARVEEVFTGPVDSCYFGAEDFVADMGGVRTRGNLEVLYARSRVALAARIAGVHAVDQIVGDLQDEERYRTDAAEGRAIGYRGKLCIHTAQVALANAVFSPSPAEVDYARRLVAAYEAAAGRGEGTMRFEGEMIDEPMARRARAVLAASADDGS